MRRNHDRLVVIFTRGLARLGEIAPIGLARHLLEDRRGGGPGEQANVQDPNARHERHAGRNAPS